jgi:hypothetical protein
MSKVYLLLRNNQQSGPFTIDELLQQQLRPTDMLWIEGRSTAWCYLSEMELNPSSEYLAPVPELKPQVAADPANRFTPSPVPKEPEETKKPRRSYRPDEIERKADELRKRALSFAPQHSPHKKPEMAVSEKHHIKLPLSEEEALDFVDHRNEKKLPGIEVLTGILVMGFVAACVIGGRALFLQKSTPQPKIAARVLSTDEHTAKKQAVPVPVIIAFDSTQLKPKIDSTFTALKPRPKPRTNSQVLLTPMNDEANNTSELQPPVKKEEDITSSVPPVAKPVVEETKQDANSKTEDVKSQTQESTSTPAEPEEKKKGFLKGLFKKKKKND